MSIYGKKPLQYCKVISLQLIKINGKKNVGLAPILSLPHARGISLGAFCGRAWGPQNSGPHRCRGSGERDGEKEGLHGNLWGPAAPR